MISAVTLSQPTQALADMADARKARLARFDAAANQHQAKLDEEQRQRDRKAQIEAFNFAMANMPRKVVPIPAPTVVLPKVELKAVDVVTVQAAVAYHFGITRSDITGRRRTYQVALARQVAMFLAKDLTKLSYPQIGRKFGWRDHTTVIHGVNKVKAAIVNKTDTGLKAMEIRRELLA